MILSLYLYPCINVPFIKCHIYLSSICVSSNISMEDYRATILAQKLDEMQNVIARGDNFFNSNPTRGGGANFPHKFSNAHSSGTESRIDLKLGCKFEFVLCLKI